MPARTVLWPLTILLMVGEKRKDHELLRLSPYFRGLGDPGGVRGRARRNVGFLCLFIKAFFL